MADLALFNTRIVRFDVYSWPVVVSGVLLLALGFFVLSREHGSLVGRRYFAFAASVALYAVGAGISYAVTTAGASLVWDRIAHIGVMSIPLTFYAATAAVLGETARRRSITRALAVVTALLLLLLWSSEWIISGNQRYFWAWYPRYGVGGWVYVLYFAVVMVASAAMYVQRHRATREALARARLRWFIVAIVVGFGGAIDFVPTLGIEIYAFGYVPIALFAVITGYAILRYRLVDITPELAASAILQTIESAVIVVDTAGIVRVANRAAHDLVGVPEPRLINIPVTALTGAERGVTPIAELPVPFSEREIPWTVESNDVRWLSVSAARLRDRGGAILGTVYVGHDVSARKRAEAQLQQAALHDELTGLPNRKLFFDRIEAMISDAYRMREHVAVLYLDLDGFKAINDGLGHAAGDSVLRAVAQRLLSTVRGSDLVARIGGDEFIVLLGHLKAPDHGDFVAGKIETALSAPIVLDTGSAEVGVSIGCAVWPVDGGDADTLLAVADNRMYTTKHARRLTPDE